MTRGVIFQVPAVPACEIGENACNVFVENRGRSKVQSALGTLAKMLPKITWDREIPSLSPLIPSPQRM